MKASIRVVIGLACAAASAGAMADDGWPQQPVKVVVAYPAGAMGDTVMRLLSDELSRRLKQPVVIDNRAGAGGNIGSSAVAHARPDGYTVLMAAANNYSINQYLYQSTGFDAQKDLLPVAALVNVPSVLFTSSQVPATQSTASPAACRTSTRLSLSVLALKNSSRPRCENMQGTDSRVLVPHECTLRQLRTSRPASSGLVSRA